MIIDYLFLPVIFLVGSVTSYQDYKFGKIKNKWILRGLIWAAGVYLALGFLLLLGDHLAFLHQVKNYISYTYILNVLLNAFISLAVGYVIWHFDLWSAGDAKLFFLFSLLLPLTYYWRSYLPFFPSFALLVNVFIPALAFLFFQNVFFILKDILKWKKSIHRNNQTLRDKVKIFFTYNYPTIIKNFFTIILIFLLFQSLRQMTSGHLESSQWLFPIIFLALFGASDFFRRILSKTYVLVPLLLILAVYLAISGRSEAGKMFAAMKNSFALFIVFLAVASIFSSSEKRTSSQKMPFAVWIFLGVIITLALKGSLLSFFF